MGLLPALPVTIVELSGSFRPIILTGSNLPRENEETTLGGKMRGKTTWYPGSETATSQTLGLEYEPIVFAGMFEDRRTGLPGGAVSMMLLIESVARSGRDCLFSYGPFVRTVRWVSWQFRPTELARIRYEIQLQPIDNGNRDLKRVFQRVRSIPAVSKVVDAASEALALIQKVPGVSAATSALKMAGVQTAASTAVQLLAGLNVPGVLIDSTKASAALTHLDSGREALQGAQEAARGMRWQDTSGSRFSGLANQGRTVLDAHAAIGDVTRELQSAREETAVLAGEPRTGRVYITALGDTLHRLSDRFYGTPSRWHDIMRINGKKTPEVVAGESLLLPDSLPEDRTVVA